MLVALASLLWVVTASAFKPPPLNGHVIDSAGLLTQQQVLQIDHKLDLARQQTGFAVVVFVPASLEGEDISDVAYTTFNAWGVGSKKGDDGVLLVIAPQEKKTRIETGKGVGGALTDLQSSHINREVINPLLKQGQYFEAIDKGTDAILHELVAARRAARATTASSRAPRRRSERNGRREARPPPSAGASAVKTIGIAHRHRPRHHPRNRLADVPPDPLLLPLLRPRRRWRRRGLGRRWRWRRLGVRRRRRQLGRRRLERRLVVGAPGLLATGLSCSCDIAFL